MSNIAYRLNYPNCILAKLTRNRKWLRKVVQLLVDSSKTTYKGVLTNKTNWIEYIFEQRITYEYARLLNAAFVFTKLK